MKLNELQQQLEVRRDAHNRRVGQRDALLSQFQQTETDLQNLSRWIDLNEQVRYLLQQTSRAARETARQTLEDIVTSGLQYIFGPDYRFVIEMEEKAGRTEASFYIECPAPDGQGSMRLRPEASNGGGVVDIVGLTLRLAVLRILQDPKVADVLILDEPGRMLSSDNAELLASFLKWASNHFGVQVLMVTHNESLTAIADRSFIVQKRNGASSIVGAPAVSVAADALPGVLESQGEEALLVEAGEVCTDGTNAG